MHLRHGLFLGLLMCCAPLAGQGWVDVSNPTNHPGGRNNAGMCYDEARGYCLLSSGDTWTFNGTTWTQLFPATTPSVASTFPGSTFTEAYEYRMAYDVGRQRVILGVGARYVVSQWRFGIAFFEWDGTTWYPGPVLANLVGSNQQCGPQLFDIAHDRMTGQTLVVTPFAQPGTWIYSPTALAPQSSLISIPLGASVCPSTTFGQFSMFYDEVRHRVALVAQSPTSYWEWNPTAGNWVQQFPGYLGYPITSGSFGPIAFAPANGYAIGLGVDQPYTTRTLRYGSGDIQVKHFVSLPSVRYDYSIAYDRQRSKVVLMGGSGYADTWELDLGPAAAFTTFGTGCLGTAGTPTLATVGQLPVAGQTFSLQVSGMAWTTPAFMFVGLSNSAYAGQVLPFDLGVIGAPGCMLRVSGDYLYGVAGVLGVGLWQFSVPSLPGVSFYTQAICVDPGANSLGLTVSNGGHAVIGN